MSEKKKQDIVLKDSTDETNQGAEPVKQEGEQQEQQGGLLSSVGGAIDGTTDFVNNLFDWKIFWWEFFGTALFAHGICASDGQDWYVTLSLFAGILITAPFSGGHLNPAVSFGFFIKNGIIPDPETGKTVWNLREFFGRALAQFLGACFGGFVAFTILDQSASPSIPSEDWRMLGGYFTGECFGTLMFVLTILIVTDERTKLVDEEVTDKNGKKVKKPIEYGRDLLATVATIALALHFSRAFTYKTGGGLNPGIAVGLQIWSAIDQQTWEPLIHSWLFVVGPLLGAAISAYYYSMFHLAATNNTGCFAPKEEKEEVKSQQEVVADDIEKK